MKNRILSLVSLALLAGCTASAQSLQTIATGEHMRNITVPKINAAITQTNTNTTDIGALEDALADLSALETQLGAIDILTAAEVDSIAALEGYISGDLIDASELATALVSKANLASPSLTGVPTAPTAATGTDSTQLATTAFVQQEIGAVQSINLQISAGSGVDEPLENDDSYSGPIISGLNGGTTIAQWDAVYFDGATGEFLLADADGSGTRLAFGLAVAATTDGNPISIIRNGFVRNDVWTWTAGQRIYLSTTAGGLTATAPSASGDTVKEVGLAISADILFLDFGKLELTVE